METDRNADSCFTFCAEDGTAFRIFLESDSEENKEEIARRLSAAAGGEWKYRIEKKDSSFIHRRKSCE